MTTTSPDKPSGFVTSVESVRGLAALSVAITHSMGIILMGPYHQPVYEIGNARDLVLKLLHAPLNGEMAVTVFFVISGFVIGRSLDKHSVDSAVQRYTGFLIQRGFRLYPAHLTALAGITVLGLLVFTGAPAIDFSPYPRTDAQLAAWLNGTVFNRLQLKSVIGNATMLSWTMNLVVWSLFVELCIAPVLPLFHKASRLDRAWMDALIVGALIAIGLAAWGHISVQYAFVFYLGVVVQTRGRQWAAMVRRYMNPGLAAVASWLVMTLPSLLMEDRPPALVIMEGFGAFSLISVIAWPGASRAFRFLDNPVLRWNGRLSYSFYLWHFFLLTIAVHWIFEHLSPETLRENEVGLFSVTLIGTAALALWIAHMSHAFIELPFIGVGRRVVAMWRPLVAPRPMAAVKLP